ncbi:MAG TPA: zinc ribbon domain-containing protein [Kiritimatiellia bacterium]|nr:zinc ribbon domain-containing protein [Kiritimatiellia bacterium]HNR95168.1 zinc ribbon domain-containing protein [Kiritimatiellia bacterium]HNS80014.1 zinc ribbon domain-containing protein [Kiritimatiellia bacterium]HPA77982.1 zinc ribbon domain-containing protein [Kiritimatiellia bacterium]HQQ03851.1 zinc ribbon domain-containing protein [Kiritimatiellia bacterium]
MPLFEYKCRKCGHAFETLAASRSVKAKCPKCGSASVEKQLSTFSTSSGSSLPCESGACSSGACPTGSCPFS